MQSMKRLLAQHQRHREHGGGERLGQFFFNEYCKGREDKTLDGIFHLDDVKAKKKIEEWLINNQHIDTLPTPTRMNNAAAAAGI